MEATKKERVILYGVVPVVSAVVGAVATVIASRLLDAGNAGDAIRAVVTDPGLSAAAKTKLVELINANDQQFYDLVRNMFSSVVMLCSIAIGYGLFTRR